MIGGIELEQPPAPRAGYCSSAGAGALARGRWRGGAGAGALARGRWLSSNVVVSFDGRFLNF